MLAVLFYIDPYVSRSTSRKRESHRNEGVTNTDNVSGENYKLYPEDLQDLLDSEWGFKRRERDDVKKPGPRLNAKTLKILYYNRSVTG